MKVYKLADRKNQKVLKELSEMLKEGAILIYPTDTVYGLGSDAFNKAAVEKLYLIKGRNKDKPCSLICEDISSISKLAFISNSSYRLLERALPGPYTFILEARKSNLVKRLIGKRNGVGVRIPDSYIPMQLVKMLGSPIVSTSLNVQNQPVISSIDELPASISSRVDAAIDVGPVLGKGSTVIDLRKEIPELLREGDGVFPI